MIKERQRTKLREGSERTKMQKGSEMTKMCGKKVGSVKAEMRDREERN